MKIFKFFDNKGFILVEAIFLTLIVSFTAMLILRGYKIAVQSNQVSAIRTAALYVAQAQMSEIENHIHDNETKSLPTSYNILDDEFLIYKDFFGIDGTLKFIVETNVEERVEVKQIEESKNYKFVRYRTNIKVYWEINNINSNEYEEITKDIWISQQE